MVLLCLPNKVISPQGEESHSVLYIVSCTETGYWPLIMRAGDCVVGVTPVCCFYGRPPCPLIGLNPLTSSREASNSGPQALPSPTPSPISVPVRPLPLPFCPGFPFFSSEEPLVPYWAQHARASALLPLPSLPMPILILIHTSPPRSLWPGPVGGTRRPAGTAIVGGLILICDCHSHLPQLLTDGMLDNQNWWETSA